MKRRRFGPLAAITWLYVLWSLVPVLIAVRISFNSGKSRSSFQSTSFRWYWDDPASVWQDDALQTALGNTLKLAGLTMLIATPLGVAMAIGSAAVARARVAGREQPDAAAARHARDRGRRVAVPGVHADLHERAAGLHDPAARPRHVHGVVRRDHRPRTAAVDRQPLRGGRSRPRRDPLTQALRMVLLPQLGPAIFASLMVVFATSVDDFVISSFLSTGCVDRDRADQDLRAALARRRRRR